MRRITRTNLDALIFDSSPTEYFHFEFHFCLAPWGFTNNPEPYTLVRFRANERCIFLTEYEKRDCEREWGKICMKFWQQENFNATQVQEQLQMKVKNLKNYFLKTTFANLKVLSLPKDTCTTQSGFYSHGGSRQKHPGKWKREVANQID